MQLLVDGPRNAGSLAAEFDLSRPAVAEHLQILRRASLVREERAGRQRVYHLDARPLTEVDDWLHPFERYWRDRLSDLARFLEDPPT